MPSVPYIVPYFHFGISTINGHTVRLFIRCNHGSDYGGVSQTSSAHQGRQIGSEQNLKSRPLRTLIWRRRKWEKTNRTIVCIETMLSEPTGVTTTKMEIIKVLRSVGPFSSIISKFLNNDFKITLNEIKLSAKLLYSPVLNESIPSISLTKNRYSLNC